jgi:hypothetical protein
MPATPSPTTRKKGRRIVPCGPEKIAENPPHLQRFISPRPELSYCQCLLNLGEKGFSYRIEPDAILNQNVLIVSRSTKEAELSACWRVLRIWRDCQDNTGWSRKLSTGPVKVILAGSHTRADRVIARRRPEETQNLSSRRVPGTRDCQAILFGLAWRSIIVLLSWRLDSDQRPPGYELQSEITGLKPIGVPFVANLMILGAGGPNLIRCHDYTHPGTL